MPFFPDLPHMLNPFLNQRVCSDVFAGGDGAMWRFADITLNYKKDDEGALSTLCYSFCIFLIYSVH